MSRVFGHYRPRFAWLGKIAHSISRFFCRTFLESRHVYTLDKPYARQKLQEMREKLSRGETVWLVGIGPAGHNSGVALIEVHPERGMRLVSNDEEERFRGIKHCGEHPEEALAVLKSRLAEHGLAPQDIHAWLLTWNYSDLLALGFRMMFEQFPEGLRLWDKRTSPSFDFRGYFWEVGRLPARLQQQFGLNRPQSVISMPHHANHASMSFALSPFNKCTEPVMVTVLDGFGDEGAMSLFVVKDGKLTCLRKNDSIVESLGTFYSIISSSKGGWTSLSSEGRYMGAAAWGDGDRLTNPYYKRLRQIFYFGADGVVSVNRTMANWQHSGELDPFRQPLVDIIGPPIPQDKMWNPDAVLSVDDVRHSAITRDRVDLSAATQLIFEDVIFHIVEHFIRTSKSDRLVMTGGTALNCLANMKLVEHFDRDWYLRNLGLDTHLKLWVPPIPGDAGVPVGAAMQFAMLAGAKTGEPMRHAFYCGRASSDEEIQAALDASEDIESRELGNINNPATLAAVGDLAACIVSQDGALGIFQGAAETGPRALGHRSILANPANPKTLQNINNLVKFREAIRPLAPMATLEAAKRFFDLADGAATDNYNAYNYMVLTVAARPEAYEKIPAVIHHDGTARLQIVRPEHDPLVHAYLKGMGRRVGAEVSVNTSLNVGSPIAQTPEQAITTLRRAKALTALLMVSAEGQARLVWHHVEVPPLKDGGRQLLEWYDAWESAQSNTSTIATVSESLSFA